MLERRPGVEHGVKLKAENVSKTYGALEVLAEVSLTVHEGEIITVVGPSGSGKTTFLNLLAGFEQADGSSRILVNGKAVNSPGPDRSVVFQQPALFPWLTVFDNILFGMSRVERKRLSVAGERMIEAVGLRGFESYFPYQLSGGMQQRTAIARALLRQPEVLLMDEPFGALDAQTRLSMQELLQEVWLEYRPAIVFITHDVDEAIFLGDCLIVLSSQPGRVRERLDISLPRPREIDSLATTEAMEAKRRVMQLLKESS